MDSCVVERESGAHLHGALLLELPPPAPRVVHGGLQSVGAQPDGLSPSIDRSPRSERRAGDVRREAHAGQLGRRLSRRAPLRRASFARRSRRVDLDPERPPLDYVRSPDGVLLPSRLERGPDPTALLRGIDRLLCPGPSLQGEHRHSSTLPVVPGSLQGGRGAAKPLGQRPREQDPIRARGSISCVAEYPRAGQGDRALRAGCAQLRDGQRARRVELPGASPWGSAWEPGLRRARIGQGPRHGIRIHGRPGVSPRGGLDRPSIPEPDGLPGRRVDLRHSVAGARLSPRHVHGGPVPLRALPWILLAPGRGYCWLERPCRPATPEGRRPGRSHLGAARRVPGSDSGEPAGLARFGVSLDLRDHSLSGLPRLHESRGGPPRAEAV